MGMKILLFNVSGEKRKALCNVGKMMNYQLIDVKKEDYGQQLGYLAGVTGFKRTGNKEAAMIPGEMLIFSGFTSSNMDTFLSNYKKTGVDTVKLKAMITPTNIFWTPKDLFAEILQEHFKMNR